MRIAKPPVVRQPMYGMFVDVRTGSVRAPGSGQAWDDETWDRKLDRRAGAARQARRRARAGSTPLRATYAPHTRFFEEALEAIELHRDNLQTALPFDEGHPDREWFERGAKRELAGLDALHAKGRGHLEQLRRHVVGAEQAEHLGATKHHRLTPTQRADADTLWRLLRQLRDDDGELERAAVLHDPEGKAHKLRAKKRAVYGGLPLSDGQSLEGLFTTTARALRTAFGHEPGALGHVSPRANPTVLLAALDELARRDLIGPLEE